MVEPTQSNHVQSVPSQSIPPRIPLSLQHIPIPPISNQHGNHYNHNQHYYNNNGYQYNAHMIHQVPPTPRSIQRPDDTIDYVITHGKKRSIQGYPAISKAILSHPRMKGRQKIIVRIEGYGEVEEDEDDDLEILSNTNNIQTETTMKTESSSSKIVKEIPDAKAPKYPPIPMNKIQVIMLALK